MNRLCSIFFEADDAPRSRRPGKPGHGGIVFALPVLAGTALFFLFPLCLTVYYSFTYGIGGVQFAGLSNYVSVFSSPRFQLALCNTLRFGVLSVCGVSLLGLAFALVLRQKFPGLRAVLRTLVFPSIVPIAGLVMLVQLFFSESGILNTWLGSPGRDWLHSGAAFWILTGLYIWKNAGFNVLLFLSALAMIPDELYQSAALDGAGSLRRFFCITLPMLRPSLFLIVVFNMITSFKAYREAFLLGGDQPHDSIYFLQHFLNNNFEKLNYQRLSVAAITLFVLILLVIAVLYVFEKRSEEG